MATSAPVLDLTTTEERPIIRINGVAYDVRLPQDLTLAGLRTLERLMPRSAILIDKLDLSNDEQVELSALLATVCELAVAAPAPVLARLGDVQRAMVFRVFTELLSPGLEQAGAVLTQAMLTLGGTRPHGGTRSSHGSNGSTAATRSHGGPRSRSGSSRRT